MTFDASRMKVDGTQEECMTSEQDNKLAAPPAIPSATFDDLESVLRLLVGAGVLGADELLLRLRKWEAQTVSESHPAGQMPLEDDFTRLRYALIGLLFSASKSALKSANDVVNYGQRRTNAAYRMLDDAARLPLIGLIAAPMKRTVDDVTRRREDEVERLIRIGRVEERDGRRLAAVATDELIGELLMRVGNDPEVSNIIQNQSVDMAGDMLDDFRQGTVKADKKLDNAIRRLLGRPTHEEQP
jgi:hypothetical protein